MREFHDFETRERYRAKEKGLFIVFIILSILIFCLQVVGPWINFVSYITYEIGDVIEGSLLLLTFIYLMHKMRNNYKKQYNQHKCSMILFFFLEIHVYFYWYMLPYIFKWVCFLDNDNNWNAYTKEFEYGVLYLIQAAAILYIKPTHDLLEGISKLDYLNLVSIFQI